MEDRRGRNGRMSVPQFGSWENQGGGRGGSGGGPNPADGYTMVFTKARADRKEQKANKTVVPSHIAMNPDENEAQYSSQPRYNHHRRHVHHQHHHNHYRHGQEQRRHRHESSQNEAVGKKNILTYLNCCCIRP